MSFNDRSLSNFLKIKSLLNDNAIGELRYVSIILNKTIDPDILNATKSDRNWRVIPEISGGGYFFDLASHQLDILDFLFGPIREAQGFKGNQAGLYPAEDIVIGSFKFESGLMGQGTWCFTTSEISDKEEIRIVGSKGEIVCSCFGDQSFTIELEGQAKQHLTFTIPTHIQQPLIQSIVDDLLGKGKCPSTGISGARTSKVMDQLCGFRNSEF
jgi:predicted dehydrogenase